MACRLSLNIMKFKNILGLMMILLIAAAAAFAWYEYARSLSSLGFTLSGIDDFVIEERYTPYFSGPKEEVIYARSTSGILRLTLMTDVQSDSAEQYARSRALLLEGMFDPRLPPYPEFLTTATGCAEEFLPQRAETSLGYYYTVYADERFNYGICAHDLAKYKAGMGVFYCKNSKQMVKIDYFIDASENMSEVDRLMRSYECK